MPGPGQTLTRAREAASKEGGTSILGAILGGIAAAQKRREEEDRQRKHEEEVLKRELQKMNEEETQKRITDLQKAREESKLKRQEETQKFGFQRKLEEIKGAETRRTKREEKPETSEDVKEWAWKQYQQGNRNPEVLKALGMFVSSEEAMFGKMMGFGEGASQMPFLPPPSKEKITRHPESGIEFNPNKEKIQFRTNPDTGKTEYRKVNK